MKITKKYECKLSKDGLDKDIEAFIKDVRKGAFEWDYKYGMEGLRIIKQYFKLIQAEFDKGNYELCEICYKKLLFFLFEEVYENSYFGYEDIIGRSKLDFEKLVKNYFICLIRLHDIDRLFNEFIEYLRKKKEYYFESAEKTIMEELSDKDFAKFKGLLLLESNNLKKDDYALQDILMFLLDIAKKKEKDEKQFMEMAERFVVVLGYSNLKEFLEDYEEDD